MQKSRVIVLCLLALVLSGESAHRRLKSLNDLKEIDFRQSVPKHSLLLLHWFANIVEINNNNVLYLTFDPNIQEYGSHHYGNYEDMLDPLPRGYRYYTVGNLYADTSHELPDYVLNPPVREYEDGDNMDRIIFRVQETNSGVDRIDRVYLTQHYRQHEQQGTRYNPEHTYQISTTLLQQMRMFSVQDNHISLRTLRDYFHSGAEDSRLRDIRNTWGESLACLGLLLFIVIQEKESKKKPIKNRDPSTVRRNTQQDSVVNIPDDSSTALFYSNHSDQVQLEVITGKNGKATIVWRNISRLRSNEGAAVVLFKHDRDPEVSSTYKLINSSEGSYDTSVPLTEGLQVRLHKARRRCIFWTKVENEICRGPEFRCQGPVVITGYNAYLQLFVKDGNACARLYVMKSFRQWESEFEKSWVGFYTSAAKETDEYKWWKWQWANKFQQGPDAGDYNTFEFCSGMTIAPGVQARFIIRDYNEIARTPSWY